MGTSIVEIISHGDVIIEVPTKKGLATMRVASQVLCATSPVFRAMIGPHSPFNEALELRKGADSSEPYHLTLEDDNPNALGVTLLALHCQNDRVPLSLSWKDVVSLTIICDKYDCAAGLSVWADKWLKPWMSYAPKDSFGNWLFVAWTFNRFHDIFEQVSKKIILEGRYTRTGLRKFVTKEGINYDSFLIPEPVMRRIHEERSACIDSIVDAMVSCRDRYWTISGESVCKISPPEEGCDATILGSLMKGFKLIGADKDCKEFSLYSIEEIRTKVESLQINFLQENSGSSTHTGRCRIHRCKCIAAHRNRCDPLPALRAEVSEIYHDMTGLSLEEFKNPKLKAPEVKWDLFQY